MEPDILLEELKITELVALQCKKGTVLVLSIPLDRFRFGGEERFIEQADKLEAHLERLLGYNVPVVIIDDEIKLHVVDTSELKD